MKFKDDKRLSFDGNHRILEAAISRNGTSQNSRVLQSNANFRQRKRFTQGVLNFGVYTGWRFPVL